MKARQDITQPWQKSSTGSGPTLPKQTSSTLHWTKEAVISRRNFLKSAGGALIVGFVGGTLELTARQANALVGAGSNRLDAWIAIGSDGVVTAYTGKCELGTGLFTAQTQLIAEELSVPFERVKLIASDTAYTPDQGITSGAQSHPVNFNQGNLALAGATAREALLAMAALKLNVPVDQLTAKDGVVSHNTDVTKNVTYDALVGGRKFDLPVNPNAKRKHPSEWTVLGTSVPRVELPDMVMGRFEYVHNVKVPGMLHGRVVRPPSPGATLVSVDENSVKDMPGVVKVVVNKNFVGVVAEKPYQALQAAGKLKVSWTAGTSLPRHETIYEHLRNQKPTRDTLLLDTKDVDQKLANAARVVKATYHYPYQMHGSIGTSCAVADVQGETATIWSPTQGVHHMKATAAMVLGLKPENLRVIYKMGSGCYGLNGADAVTYDAALMSQAVGKPVRVQLTRKDEMMWENYGLAHVIDQRAALDADGNLLAWDYESWVPVLGARPNATTPGNVITGSLVGFAPTPFVPESPAPAPSAYVNGSNAIPSYVAGTVNGRNFGTGKVPSHRVLRHNIQSVFFTGPLRAPERLQNTYAQEAFVDEVASAAKADPVEFRLRYLSDPRLVDVVRGAAEAANWETRPSPKANARQNSAVAMGRGIACALHQGDNGYCAMVAEVEVRPETGMIAVKRLVIAHDCGPMSNPDGVRNQLEGGALSGISRTLLEQVTWDDQKITSVDWRSYRALSLGIELPKIETVLINRTEGKAMGVGETSIILVGAAISNAVFDATGVRLREVPFNPDKVKAAFATRT